MRGRWCLIALRKWGRIRRHDHHQHSIFYRPREEDIFILRILNQRMDPIIHVFEPHQPPAL
jgi:plasmid stabilization system protein ParE